MTGLALGRAAIGFVLASAIALAGWRARALTRSGSMAAVVVGTIVTALGGWLWAWVLVAFFVSSSLLSRFRRERKAIAQPLVAKGETRDAGQVLANGGLGTLLAVWHGISGRPEAWALYLGAMAAVNADTWGTEIGLLSQRRPRHILTWREVAPGTSGGVTAVGSAAAAAGALFIGVTAWVGATFLARWGWTPHPNSVVWWPLWAASGGIGGALCDSLLGATLQGMFYCERCRTATEQSVHRCGAATTHTRGWKWLNNDWVNFLSSLVGGLIALELTRWF